MKKYAQLSLVIICIISVIAMFVYQRRYANARMFLEVVDMFESHVAEEKCEEQIRKMRENISQQLTATVPLVLPRWTRVNNINAFVYSAVWQTNSSRALIVAILPSKTSPTSIGCLLWSDERTYVNASVSIVTVYKSNVNVCMLQCIPPKTTRYRILGVSFYSKEISFMDQFKERTVIPLDIQKNNIRDVGASICVPSVDYRASEMQLVEFITYHSAIGFKTFYIYDAGLFIVSKQILRVASMLGIASIQVLDWQNVPSLTNNVAQAVIVADCITRSAVSSTYVAPFLALNTFISYRMGNDNISSWLPAMNSRPVVMHKRSFCLEYSDDVVAAALNYPFITQRKVRFDAQKSASPHRPVLVKSGAIKSIGEFLDWKNTSNKAMLLPDTSATINVYEYCHQRPSARFSSDAFMLRYHSTLFGSKLYAYVTKQQHKPMIF